MTISWPTDTKVTIDAIRSAIGRYVNFVTKLKEDCPTCILNPYTGESTNPFCPTCSGAGYVITLSGQLVNAHITWNPSETMNWVSAGKFQDYSCRIQVEYSTENANLVNGCAYVEIDDKQLRIENKTYRGVKELNRILLDLREV